MQSWPRKPLCGFAPKTSKGLLVSKHQIVLTEVGKAMSCADLAQPERRKRRGEAEGGVRPAGRHWGCWVYSAKESTLALRRFTVGKFTGKQLGELMGSAEDEGGMSPWEITSVPRRRGEGRRGKLTRMLGRAPACGQA